MLSLKFSGWFQCRLSSDPDPYDEPRGISGDTRCLLGEPDLDRIIRFHNPIVQRTYCPPIGVFVTNVIQDNAVLSNNPLQGALLNFEDSPQFCGHNGIVAERGEEPIVPLTVSLSVNSMKILERKLSDTPPAFPFNLYRPNSVLHDIGDAPCGGLVIDFADIAEQTGIYNVEEIMKGRIEKLQEDLLRETDDVNRINIESRINSLNIWITKLPRSAIEFSVKVCWNLSLSGAIINTDSNTFIELGSVSDWLLSFWMGGWDNDGMCGFVNGLLVMPDGKLLSQNF